MADAGPTGAAKRMTSSADSSRQKTVGFLAFLFSSGEGT